MRGLLVLFVLLAGSFAGNFIKSTLQKFAARYTLYDDEWLNFKERHNKEYENVDEEIAHAKAFKTNLETVVSHNSRYEQGKEEFELGLNSLADLPRNEYLKLNGYRRPLGYKRTGESFSVPDNAWIADEIDWRTKGFVTPVKDQGSCGSCWAFSSTGSLEGQHKRQTGDLVSLSEQNLVDCSHDYGNNGCNGGLMDNAFEYIKDNHGIDTEEGYPYKAKDGRCRFSKRKIGANDTGFVDIPEGNEDALMRAVATIGPISVAIDASPITFQLYKNGIYYDGNCSSTELDHGVLVVGYGSEGKGRDYWIVKNSWGPRWGDKGYIRMARNRKNHCGIATAASYPTVD